MLSVLETNFVIEEFNPRHSSVKDENGKATRIKLNMDGKDSEGGVVAKSHYTFSQEHSFFTFFACAKKVTKKAQPISMQYISSVELS